MNNLGSYYWLQGRYAEAADLKKELLEKRRRILGSEHHDTLRLTKSLALAYRELGRDSEAAALEDTLCETPR